MISFLRQKSEKYHMSIHAVLGVMSGLAIKSIYPESNLNKMLALGFLANILPDIDHLFYFLWYGAKSDYTRTVKKYIADREIKALVAYLKRNHKYNTGIYSHNLMTLLFVLLLFWLAGLTRDSPSLSVVFLSWSLHYMYDIVEDFLFFKEINPNWFLRFNIKRKNEN